jgi:hypothetical protein
MDEAETPVAAHDPPPKKSDRTLLFVLLTMALGLVALIALNMK